MAFQPVVMAGIARLRWYHWLVSFLSLIFTVFAWYVTNQQTSGQADSISSNLPAMILFAGLSLSGLLVLIFMLPRTEATEGESAGYSELGYEKAEELTQPEEETKACANEDLIHASDLSDELRAPLNAMVGFLSSYPKSSLTEPQKVYLKDALRASNKLLSFFNNKIDYPDISAGKVELRCTEFDLNTVLDKVSEIFSLQAESEKLSFVLALQPSFPLRIVGDPQHLEQVLLNLCGNAFKFTSQGEVKLAVNFAFKTESIIGVDFIVSDTGIGMPDALLNNLIKTFSDEEAVSVFDYAGRGSGLMISSSLIELMGGDITVLSKVNEGSVFSVHLEFPVMGAEQLTVQSNAEKNYFKTETELVVEAEPLVLSESDELSEDAALERPLVGMVILLVESVELSQVMIKVLMENRGAKVTVAINAAEAIELLGRSPVYDVVLIDMQMPDMGGYELSNYILSSENLCQIPLIAMTANASLAELQKCMEVGMTAHISKPIDELDLLSKILENSVSVVRGIGLEPSLNTVSSESVESENDMAIVSPEDNAKVSIGINDLDNIDSIGSLDFPSTSKGVNDLDDLDDLELK